MSEGMQSTYADPFLERPVWQDETETWREERRGLGEFLLEYAQENPAAAALWCFGIGFVLGWRLKPW
jgi:hypothetical protein